MKRPAGFTILESLIVLGLLTIMVFVIIALAIKKTSPTFPPAAQPAEETTETAPVR